MEIYRKQIDKKILEQLKDKIQIYLKNKGFKKADFIRKNLDKVAGLYVENLIETGGPRMVSRGEKKDKPEEIAIDRGFAILDKNDNPIGIDISVRKLIMTQLTHELIHSGSRFNGQTGIKSTNQYIALNEGMTQMFTEKIWGYTLSPNADSKYKDYKKIAKIFDATFGEKISLDAYFNHTDALENLCNSLSKNSNFYNDVNYYLTSTFNMAKSVPKEVKDNYYQTIMKPIQRRMIDKVYDKVCAEIIIPKLKTLSANNRETYLHDILDSVKEEPDVLKRLTENIIKYSNITNKELQEQINGTNQELRQAEQEKQFVIDVYKSSDCSKLIEISNDGKIIKTAGKNSFIIEDESLKEKIFAQLYFQERQGIKDKFEEKVSKFYDSNKTDFNFGKSTDTTIARKKIFSAMKLTARNQGHAVLNTLEECESGDNLKIHAVEVQVGQKITFQDLKNIHKKLDVFNKDDDYTKLYVCDRTTGKEVLDPQLQIMGKFAALWKSAAGTKRLVDEELVGITYAFNESSEQVFTKLGELVEKSMKEKGKIDTEDIYKTISSDSYKHSGDIIRTLLSNPASVKIVYDFYKMQNKDAKLETKLAQTTNELLFGYSEEKSMVEQGVEDIIASIPGNDEKRKPIAEDVSTSMFNMAKESKQKSRDVLESKKELKTNYRESINPTIEIDKNKMMDDE